MAGLVLIGLGPTSDAAVLGLFLLLALYRCFRPQRLVITPTRVVVGREEIPWDAIDDVDLSELPAGSGAIRHYRRDAHGRRSIGDEAELIQLREVLGGPP